MNLKALSPHTKGILFIVLGTTLWGASGVLSQHLFTDKNVTAQWLVTARLIMSGLILLGADAYTHKGDIFSIWKTSDRLPLIIFGIFSMVGVQYTYFMAIVYSNAATSTILQYLMPVVIVLYIVVSTHRLPQYFELISIGLAMIGTFLLVTKGNFDTLALSPIALLWGLSSACFSAFYTLQPRKIIKKWRSTLIIGWGMLIGGIATSFMQPIWQFTATADLNTFLTIAGVIVFGTAIAFCSYLESTKYLSPTQISVFASLEPFSSIILSIVFLQISFGTFEIFGAVIIVVAVTMLSLKK